MTGPNDDPDDHLSDRMADDDCFQCFGRGWIANCFEEFACIDPDEGCDDCLRPCDVCNPKGKRPDL